MYQRLKNKQSDNLFLSPSTFLHIHEVIEKKTVSIIYPFLLYCNDEYSITLCAY